jgi:hypothetical protein
MAITGFEANPAYDKYDTTETFQSPIGDIQIIKDGPYGFRKIIRKDGGSIPLEYQCDYTSPIPARFAVAKLIRELEDSQKTVVRKKK